MLPPHIVLFEPPYSPANGVKQRMTLPPRETRFEIAPRVGRFACASRFACAQIFRRALQMHADGIQERRGVFAISRQRPVRFVTSPMAVRIEKTIEGVEECCAGEARWCTSPTSCESKFFIFTRTTLACEVCQKLSDPLKYF